MPNESAATVVTEEDTTTVTVIASEPTTVTDAAPPAAESPRIRAPPGTKPRKIRTFKDRAESVEPELLTEFDVARRYGLGLEWLRKDRQRARPVLPYVKIIGAGPRGGFIRYRRSQLDQLVETWTRGGEMLPPAA